MRDETSPAEGQAPIAQRLRTTLTRWISALGSVFRTLGNKDTIPYCALFPVSIGFSLSPQFSVSNYAGLLFCHIIRSGPTGGQLLTYWVDELHFRAHGDTLQSQLSIAGPFLTGPAVDLRPSKAWWKRYPVGTTILAIAALLGALSGILYTVLLFVSSPDVVISYFEPGILNTLENRPLVIPVSVTSEIRFSPVKVALLRPSLRSHSPEATELLNIDPATFEAATIPNLGPGQSVPIKIYAIAPQLPTGQVSPKSYTLAVEATAKAGIFRFSKLAKTGDRELRVWTATLKPVITRVNSLASNTCQVDATLYLPKQYPQGLQSEITVTGSPVQITDLNIAPTKDHKTDIDDKRTTAKITFSTPPLEQFQEYHYTVYLELSEATTEALCRDLSNRMEAKF